MSNTEDNRRIITAIFAARAERNVSPFMDALADDVRWITPGSSIWSRTFEGKAAVLEQLLGPVRAQLVERVHVTPQRILADGEYVIVQGKGRATTKTGAPYNNDYCFVYRLAGGKIVEVTEYLDTDLASRVLRAPWATTG